MLVLMLQLVPVGMVKDDLIWGCWLVTKHYKNIQVAKQYQSSKKWVSSGDTNWHSILHIGLPDNGVPPNPLVMILFARKIDICVFSGPIPSGKLT